MFITYIKGGKFAYCRCPYTRRKSRISEGLAQSTIGRNIVETIGDVTPAGARKCAVRLRSIKNCPAP